VGQLWPERQQNNGTTHSIGMNGVARKQRAELEYSAGLRHGWRGYTGTMNGDYKGTYGEVTAGYGYDKNSERLNYGLQGDPRPC
jgi:outer membrane usher protein